jgi:EAL domain-containing protein (putative c-di-GMP-specific phosphodiesterase class I)
VNAIATGIPVADLAAAPSAHQRALRRASFVIAAAVAFVALSAVVVAFVPEEWVLPVDYAQQLIATFGGMCGVLAMRSTAPPDRRWLTGALGLGLGLAGLGMLAWGLTAADEPSAAGPAGALFVLALVIVSAALLRAFTMDLDRARLREITIDGIVVAVAATCLLAPVWFPMVTGSGDVGLLVAVVVSVSIIAAPLAGYLALLHLRLQPGMWGPYAALDGLLVGGLSWLAWLVLVVRGEGTLVTPIDWGFSASVLMLAWGGMTWDRRPAMRRGFRLSAPYLVDLYPLVGVGACVPLMIMVDGREEEWVVKAGTAVVVALVLLRQWLLVRRERLARDQERRAAARLAREIRHRAHVLGSLAAFEAGATADETAQRICERAIALGDMDQAAIIVFEPDGSGFLLAEAGPARTADSIGRLQPPEVARRFQELAAAGPWLEPVEGRTDPHGVALQAAGLRWVAHAPVVFGGRLLGRLSLAAAGDAGAELHAERLTTVREFGMLAGAILGASLDERARLRATRASIRQVIDGWAFRSVFQPIVELATGRVVGHEALTRFEDGSPPDVRFAEAATVGLGPDLERATLESAIRSAVRLPHDTYISLNASPELASDVATIAALVARAPCAVVLEITEHAAVASYADLRESLHQLRPHVRIAVDDVGAGYAGLRHILEIEPDLLKLDIALVRSVDQDAAKRALIGSIVTFGRGAGCTVVAEGVETRAEADTLLSLGVTLGQGYLFGRPERIDQIAVDGWLDEAGARPG